MSKQKTSLLGYALLGLLQQEARSGYDLRKIFATTPMTSFSDSPGSIYPALRRLATGGLIRSNIQDRHGLRRRMLFQLTTAGTRELHSWQRQEITRDDVIHRLDELMLRFGFMGESLGDEESLRFLIGLERELSEYIPSLREHLERFGPAMPLSGRLALESGILSYETLLRWAREGIKTYKTKARRRS